MKKKVIWSLIAVLLIIILSGLATPAFAQENPGEEGPPPDQPKMKHGNKKAFMDRMKLTEDQKKKMMGIRQKYSGKIDDISFELLETRVTLAKELKKDEPDREAITKLIKKTSSLEERKMVLIIDEFFEVKKILTQEQRNFYMRRFIKQMTRTKSGM